LRVIVGLGNPGIRYQSTRHNIGVRVLERTSEQWSIGLHLSGPAWLGQGHVGSPAQAVDVVLAIPQAWMNQSGQAVKALLDQVACAPHDLVIVHDDLDLEVGRLRIKRSGGTGGHNGVESIITELGTDQFSRMKIGIGRPAPGMEAEDYVLEAFSKDELSIVDESIDRAVLALECLVLQGLDAAMNQFNANEPEGEE